MGAGKCTGAARVEQVQPGGKVAHPSSASQRQVQGVRHTQAASSPLSKSFADPSASAVEKVVALEIADGRPVLIHTGRS